MRSSRNPLVVLLILSMVSLILGCMEEEAANTTTKKASDQNNGTDNMAASPMNVEITNVEYQWKDYPGNPFRLPDLSVTCDAINYGGSGRTTVVVVANGSEGSVVMQKVIQIAKNGQVEVKLSGKMPAKPLSIAGHTERNLLSIVTQPAAKDMDVEIVNLNYDVTKWVNTTKLELDVVVRFSAINYGLPGYFTLVVQVDGEGFSKPNEERKHIGWYQQLDFSYSFKLPGPPENVTAHAERFQKD